MRNTNYKLLILAAALLGTTACVEGESSDTPDSVVEDEPCGIRVCATGEVDGPIVGDEASLNGKADADDMRSALGRLVADGVLDADDVRALFDETGDSISLSEMEVVHEAVHSTDYEVTMEAMGTALRTARVANIEGVERDIILEGMSFAGTKVPEEVQNLVASARLAGAVAYDVTERDSDGEGKWSHYPATAPPVDNMAWDYTLITPEKLFDDLNDTTVKYNAIVGSETGVTATGREYKRAKYEERTGGTGNVSSHYDEVFHPDLFARGRNGQIWANNFAILSDGTIHALPACRRSVLQDVILTNPALSRGAHLMYHGHLDIRAGEVVGVELSGMLSKRAAKGKTKFIDPIALLKAWGFVVQDGVRVRYGNTSDGVPVVNEETNVIEKAAE